MTSLFLVFAAMLLLAVITVQNLLYPPLREETISDGLYGPYHWFLDGAYVVLAAALSLAFWDVSLLSRVLAVGSASALLITAFTNTFSGFVDKIKAGLHTKLHTWFTVVMFVLTLTLEYVNDNLQWMKWLTTAGIAGPVAIAGVMTLFKNKVGGPVAEKLAVFLMCSWLIAWAVVK